MKKTIKERQQRTNVMGKEKRLRHLREPEKDKEAEQKIFGKRRNRNEIIISWWNGGGKLISRIKINPVLKHFLGRKLEIFAYGEAQIYKATNELNICDYRTIVHTALRKGNWRGIVVYYRKTLENIITREHSSEKFDIIWLRMKSPEEECLIVFFYAPG